MSTVTSKTWLRAEYRSSLLQLGIFTYILLGIFKVWWLYGWSEKWSIFCSDF